MYYNVISFIIVNIVTMIINKFEWISLQDLLTLDPKAGQIRHGLVLRPKKLDLAAGPIKVGSGTQLNFSVLDAVPNRLMDPLS